MRKFVFFVLLISIPPLQAADYQIEANIHYDHHAETVLDILQPRAPALKDRPGVIVIHGGGWIQGDKESVLERFCIPFIQHDFVVANVEYRLAKVAPAPAALKDVLNAAKWFHDHAVDYRVDADHILVAGDSAGAHLALMVGMLPASADLGPVTKIFAIIDFYGIADVADLLDGDARPWAQAWIPDQPGRMELARRLSPITYVRKGLPPILAIHGDADPVVPFAQSARLADALKSARSDAELIAIPGGQHGFTPDQMSALWPRIFKWLKKHKIGS